MLPLPSQKFLVEDFLQHGRPQFHRRFQRLAVGGIVDRESVDEPLGVVGLVQSKRGAQRPSVELQGQGNLGAQVEASQQFCGMKAGLAARKAGQRSVERPEERRVPERPVHAGCIDAGSVQDLIESNAADWTACRSDSWSERSSDSAPAMPPTEKPLTVFGQKELRLHF